MESSRFAEYCQSRHPPIIDMHSDYNSLYCEPNVVYQMSAYWLKYKQFETVVYRSMATVKCDANYYLKAFIACCTILD